jgi:hypothetical protein
VISPLTNDDPTIMSYSRRGTRRGGGEDVVEEQAYQQTYEQQQYYQPQEVQSQEEVSKQPRAALYQKTDQQIKILNQWWKSKTRRGNIDKTLVDTGEKQKLSVRRRRCAARPCFTSTHPNPRDPPRSSHALPRCFRPAHGPAPSASQQKTGLPMKILENWLGNTRKKARKIAREQGQLPPGPITKCAAHLRLVHCLVHALPRVPPA